MVNTIWKEVFLIMCSCLKENARHSGRFLLSLRITNDYALQILCGEQHNICNEEGLINGLPFNRSVPGGYGGVFGTFFICGLGVDDFCSLPPELMERFKKEFKNSEILLGFDGNEAVTLKVSSQPKPHDPPPHEKSHSSPER